MITALGRERVNLHSTKPDIARSVKLDTPAKWGLSEYAWFDVSPISDGTDAYFRQLSDLDRKAWNEEIAADQLLWARKSDIEACLSTGYYWCFRKSAG